MTMDRDNNNQDWTPDDGGQWTKEEAKRDPRFDFAAFLGPENLDDQITDALDGKDLMDQDAYGDFAPDYVPRRSAPDGHGRHEVPGSDTEEDEEEAEEEAEPFSQQEDAFHQEEEMDFQQDPQQEPVYVDEPPPRPKVIVAEPAPRVYVDPHTEYGESEEPPASGGGKGAKWLIAALISAAVILGAVVLVTTFLPDIGDLFGRNSASPAPSDVLGGIPDVRPTDIPAPTNTPELAAPEVKIFNVTASSSGGGAIYPSGKVDVQEGGSAGFTFTAEDGYEISKVTVDGVEGSIQTGYTFTDVRQDHTIYVEFRQVEAPPTAVVVTDEPTPEPTAEPTETPVAEMTPEPTAEPAETPVAEAAPEPQPEDTEPEEPPFVGGEGQPEPLPEEME